MKATFEQGTELVVSSESIAFQLNWKDIGSDVFRCGPQVTVVIRATKIVAEAWEKKKYLKGERVTEGGHTYEAIVTETDEAKPSTKLADWKDLGTTPAELEHICTLPVEYRPTVDVLGAGGAAHVKTTGTVSAAASVDDVAIYRAAGVSP